MTVVARAHVLFLRNGKPVFSKNYRGHFTEWSSPPEDIAATFVGGPKRVPIRYRIEPRD